jgi:N-acyl-D-aspartate/D-glutamate deacylase
VVSPGFIDLHSHSQTQIGQSFQVLDGVTTALELEAGAYPSATVGSQIADKALINFGASAGYFAMRIKVMEDKDQPYFFFAGQQLDISGPGFKQTASDEQIGMLRRHLNLGLDQGGLGIGLLLDYMSDAISDKELEMIFDVAAKRRALIAVHLRRGLAGDDSGLKEVIALASETGASVHICHVHANAMGEISNFLSLIKQARNDGIDITSEAYPYNAGSTSISAEVFDRDWRKIFAISYEDVQVADTGQRFTESMWEDYRETKPNTSIIHHYGKEHWTQEALKSTGLIIASDASPIFSTAKNVHPRGMGTFTRVLGRYVRDIKLLDLPTAIKKMTLLPAQRMETVAPSFARKGRLQVGADADIVIFNPKAIQDNATYTDPYQAPDGIKTVIVNGRIVVADGQVIEGVYPGKIIIGKGR